MVVSAFDVREFSDSDTEAIGSKQGAANPSKSNASESSDPWAEDDVIENSAQDFAANLNKQCTSSGHAPACHVMTDHANRPLRDMKKGWTCEVTDVKYFDILRRYFFLMLCFVCFLLPVVLFCRALDRF